MTSTTFLEGRVTLHGGDCLEILRTLPDASVDSVVTDPPYHLTSIVKRFGGDSAAPAKTKQTGAFARASRGFMGQTWDGGDIAFREELWAEVLRVLKPGGHLAAFSGTRTYHRMAVAIEDAGFEIRDQLAWTYGSGFPKSHDVAKGIQRRRTEDLEPIRVICRAIRAVMDASGVKSKDLTVHFGGCHARLIDHWAARDTDSQPSLPTWQQWLVLQAVLPLGVELDGEVWRLNGRKGSPGAARTEAEIIAEHESATPGFVGMRFSNADRTIRAASDEAEAWQGWGTALKPAWEPICLARKSLDGTVAANVLAHGVGALNIDGCRIEAPGETIANHGHTDASGKGKNAFGVFAGIEPHQKPGQMLGRFPANLIHDGSAEVLAAFPQQVSGSRAEGVRKGMGFYGADGDGGPAIAGSAGSAARFFYTAKADADDRIGSKHPTVKPVDLMQWLVRLVTPKGGVVLDLFAGTGTTGEAAWREGCRAVLIEREPVYREDIARRMSLAAAGPQERRATIAAIKAADDHGLLFGLPVAAE